MLWTSRWCVPIQRCHERVREGGINVSRMLKSRTKNGRPSIRTDITLNNVTVEKYNFSENKTLPTLPFLHDQLPLNVATLQSSAKMLDKDLHRTTQVLAQLVYIIS